MVEVINYREEEAVDKLYGIGGNCKMSMYIFVLMWSLFILIIRERKPSND